jgi:hypothetical protein
MSSSTHSCCPTNLADCVVSVVHAADHVRGEVTIVEVAGVARLSRHYGDGQVGEVLVEADRLAGRLRPAGRHAQLPAKQSIFFTQLHGDKSHPPAQSQWVSV